MRTQMRLISSMVQGVSYCYGVGLNWFEKSFRHIFKLFSILYIMMIWNLFILSVKLSHPNTRIRVYEAFNTAKNHIWKHDLKT